MEQPSHVEERIDFPKITLQHHVPHGTSEIHSSLLTPRVPGDFPPLEEGLHDLDTVLERIEIKVSKKVDGFVAVETGKEAKPESGRFENVS